MEFTTVEALRRLCVALGIDPDARPISKIVIEVSVSDVARATIHELIPDAKTGALCEVITDLFAPTRQEAP